MHLKRLSLLNYKNFETREFEFDAKINCLVGSNGVGKTNVLDSIYHLAFGKSYFNPVTTQNIRHGEEFFVIEGLFEKKDREERIVCSFKKGGKKVLKRNGKVYDRISDHIGQVPLVIVSPSDRDLILEGSDVRRKFMDGVISQSDKGYLQDVLDYQKLVSQRNALLKFFAANRTFDADSLEVYNDQLHALGTRIYEKRVAFMVDFTPIFAAQYKVISGGDEPVQLSYQSQLDAAPLSDLLRDNLEKDRVLQYTSQGIHKDDLNMEIGGHPIKKFGSQGQQKSFLIALKFAQFQFMKAQVSGMPVLLLDDIFDKLDEDRVSHIISLVNQDHFGQIFISDTHAERTEATVKRIHQTYALIAL
ncbi:DNA replication/repair protein RecF [Robiginitalea aurantiaca]|uniref:DNA replication and repair protein RecF n=1 Tax=Robiginitalea aurantiaca TaxID=3056915 RepID=A0ABT7WGK6_9FLAO|nr:DNA replication/repair protein RecF [Robiginitalea aurantiaca]MDM9632057.1 DNA replication/repair protein RecF [Robiginitalea aurantiaca]